MVETRRSVSLLFKVLLRIPSILLALDAAKFDHTNDPDHTNDTFECKICRSNFTRKDNLKYHQKNIHENSLL